MSRVGDSLSRSSGDKYQISLTLRNLGVLARWSGQYEHAQELLHESLAETRSLGYYGAYSLVRALSQLARLGSFRGDFVRARGLFSDALRINA